MVRLPFKERIFLSVVVVGLAAVLVALAILQYRWSNEISDAAGARLQANLSASMLSWRDDLYRELTSGLSALQANPMLSLREKEAQYAQQYQAWSQTASHANLVSHVFLAEGSGTNDTRFLQLNTTTNKFEAADWPPELANLHTVIDAHAAEFVNMMHNPNRMGGPRPHMEFRPAPIGDTGTGGAVKFPNRRLFGPELATIDLQQMVVIRPQFYHGPNGPQISWIIVALDRKILQERILPELAERYFSGSEAHDYEVAVVTMPGSSLIYSSDSGFGKQDTASLDGKMPVFGFPRIPNANKGANPPPFGPGPALQSHDNGRHQRREIGFPGAARIAALPVGGADSDWQLLLRHRKGSLEAVVAGIRHRDLAISFGVLLVLAAGIGIILISSQRARVLARLQMDFVAAVSHELRTPLTVISSAAENIADGVVAGKQQLSQYGIEIKNQARQLMQLVEQILLFAATRDKRHHYNLRPLRVVDLIEAALKDTTGLIDSAGVTVEQEIAPNLPPVVGDLPALSHCLQNLITNAVKYGGDARWMRITAGVHEQNGQFHEVQISVEDKGLGIGAAELRRIFEPFYRSRAAAAAQIHGTGLGLSLARDIAEAMGGRLTVVSEPGKGSCFTVYLPFADVSQLQTSPQTSTAAVNPNL